VENVTSCAFGGAKLDRLFITTAVNPDAKVLEPEAGFVFCLEPGVPGLPAT
jgi:sugar lactone lactonase YvrE